jgi:hypothetical protein
LQQFPRIFAWDDAFGVVLPFHGLLTRFMDAVWLLAYMTGSAEFKINGCEGCDAVVPYVSNHLRGRVLLEKLSFWL